MHRSWSGSSVATRRRLPARGGGYPFLLFRRHRTDCVRRREGMRARTPRLAAGNGPYHKKGLRPRRDPVGQRGVRRLMGQILLAGEEPQERSALLRDVVADRPAQHRIAGLERVEDRALRGRTLDVELHLASHAGQHPQMKWKQHSDHGSVWTSTDTTAGRSRTMGAQLSPASADTYTCPPVVPKYTPHESSESTAIASRNTLT